MDDELVAAAADDDVRRATKALMLKAIGELAVMLEDGSPDRKDKALAMVAGPVVKEVLSPQKKTRAEEQDELRSLTNDFHEVRRQMMDHEPVSDSP